MLRMIPCFYRQLIAAFVVCACLFPSVAGHGAIPSSAAISAMGLQVAGLENPVGVDDRHPEFAWTLSAVDPRARNLSQSAYQMLVATSAEMLAAGKGDMWDSGRVAASVYRGVAYGGQPLRSHTRYFWKVRVWDQKGAPSRWAPAAQWTTALLDLSEWQAKWIAAEPDAAATRQAQGDDNQTTDTVQPKPIFRHEFALGKQVKQAVVFVSGLGEYELSLNGNTVGDAVLNPGWSAYRKTILYQTYDVTTAVRKGANSVAVMLGGGMYDVPGVKGRYTKFVGSMGQSKLIMQMHVTYADGSTETVVSDKTWKTTAGPIVFSSTYGGEDYDARGELQGWKEPGFNDVGWAGALEVAAPKEPGAEAGGQLSGQIFPSMKVVRSLKPVKVTVPQPGVTVYDFGENFSGWPSISVRGRAGDVIKMTPAELLDPSGIVSQASANAYPADPVLMQYTLRGTGQPEIWHPRFMYYGFRYVQVEMVSGAGNSASKPELLSIEHQVIHDRVRQSGEFKATLPLFNRIHRLIDNAIESNMASVLTDCPTREKLGWLEQTHLMGNSIMANYGVLGLYRKMARDMADSQLTSGLVPAIAPEYVAFLDQNGHDTAFRDSPEWGSAMVLSPWTAYQIYGDQTLLADAYPAMTRYVEFLRNKTVDHVLEYGLGDWYDIGPGDPGESQLTVKGITATAVYYQDLQAMIQIAGIIGTSQDVAALMVEAAAVKEAFNRHYFHAETNVYDRGSQTAQAMPLVVGLVPDGHQAGVLENLISDIRKHTNHVTAGDIGFHYVVRALTDSGRSDVLMEMLTRTDTPSYGSQLAAGATTLTEAWDANPHSSQNHFMLGHAEEWFYRGLAGIDLDLSRPAPRQIVIRPAFLKEAKGAVAKIDTVLGRIRIAWAFDKAGSGWSLDVEIPVGAKATVYLPTGATMEGGRPVSLSGLSVQPAEAGGGTSLVVGSGHYNFAGNAKK